MEEYRVMQENICVIGAGYVGLPLAMALSEHFQTTVYSHSQSHIAALREGKDRTENFTAHELRSSSLRFSDRLDEVADASVYIVTVPTPVDAYNNPDLGAIKNATESIATLLRKGDLVVYESTVYVGCTEELCVPLLAKGSGLDYNKDFFCGFSPERMNPADKQRTIHNVIKIISGSTPEATQKIRSIYETIVDAGIHVAPSIKVAEASKLMENIQRDVNIALMNELSALFNRLNVDTHDVIQAASTKWNFHPYYPGLVGGHCIGVDPYYMIYNGRQQKVATPLIEQARSTNNQMVSYVIESALKLMVEKGIDHKKARVLLLGVTFKEDCPDIRNSQSVKIAKGLQSNVAEIDVFDPVADPQELKQMYGISMLPRLTSRKYDTVIISVGHTIFTEMLIMDYLQPDGVLLDLKGILPKEQSDFRL